MVGFDLRYLDVDRLDPLAEGIAMDHSAAFGNGDNTVVKYRYRPISDQFMNDLILLETLTLNELKPIPCCAENFTDPVYLDVQKRRSEVMARLINYLGTIPTGNLKRILTLAYCAAAEGRLLPIPGQ